MKNLFFLIPWSFWIFLCSCSLFNTNTAVIAPKNAKYVTNVSNSNTILLCGANSTSGLFVKCIPTATDYPFSGPWGMATSNIAGSDYVYIADSGNNTIVRCNLNADRTLSGCSSVSSYNFKSPTSIAIYKGLSSNYMYIANGGSGFANIIVKCLIQNDGTLTSCGNASTGLAADQIGTAVFNNYLYVASSSTRIVYKCNINSSSGALSSCATTGTGYSVPLSIALDTAGSFAYMADAGTNRILVCPVNQSTGDLGACSSTGAPTGSSFGQPASVSITGNWAYVSDYGTNTIFLCTINSDGTLSSSCLSTGTGYSGPVASL